MLENVTTGHTSRPRDGEAGGEAARVPRIRRRRGHGRPARTRQRAKTSQGGRRACAVVRHMAVARAPSRRRRHGGRRDDGRDGRGSRTSRPLSSARRGMRRATIAALLAALAFAGCGGDDDDSDSASTEPSGTSEISPDFKQALEEASSPKKSDFPAPAGRSLQALANSVQAGGQIGLASFGLHAGREPPRLRPDRQPEQADLRQDGGLCRPHAQGSGDRAVPRPGRLARDRAEIPQPDGGGRDRHDRGDLRSRHPAREAGQGGGARRRERGRPAVWRCHRHQRPEEGPRGQLSASPRPTSRPTRLRHSAGTNRSRARASRSTTCTTRASTTCSARSRSRC